MAPTLVPHAAVEDSSEGILGRPRADIDVPPAPLGLVALHNIWKTTRGSLSIDLKRRLFKGGSPGDSLWRVQPQAPGQQPPAARRRGRPPARQQPPPAFYGQAPPGTYTSPGSYRAGYPPPQPQPPHVSSGPLFEPPSLSFMESGARVKVMRHLQFGPKVEVVRPTGRVMQRPAVDLGVGLAFEIDTAELQPQARLKIRDIVSLKALPYPAIKIQKRLAIPETSWGVRLSYECPLEALPNFYQPPARLLLSIDNMHSNGVQLTQAGLEFNYLGDFYGGSTQLRACGLLSLPRELPIIQGQQLVNLEVRRLGLKAAW